MAPTYYTTFLHWCARNSLLQTLLPQAQRSGLIRRLAREHYRQVFEPPISLQQRRVIHLQMAAPL